MESEPIVIEAVPEKSGMTREGRVFLIFALFCFAAAYLFTSLVPISEAPLGFFVLSAAFYAVSLVAALMIGARLKPMSFLMLIMGLIVAAYRLVHGIVDMDIFPVFVLSGIFYELFILSLFGNNTGNLGGGFLLDIVKGFVFMFTSFASFFVAVFRPLGRRKGSKIVLFIIIGAAAALVLVLIVGSLLSFDENFVKLLPKIELDDILEILPKILLSVPIAAMIFSVFASSRKNMLPNLSSKETSGNLGKRAKVIPAAIVIIPIAAVLAVYVLFFVSQWAYYMSAFTHTLPEGYSFAEYARQGFFNLCVVAVINSVLIIVLSCFTKTKSVGSGRGVGLLKILLSLATLVLIATAVSKMFLYIDSYDLTRERLAVTVFLAFLAIAFVIVIFSTLVKSLKAIPVIVCVGLVMLAAFSLVNTNRFIAKYNVDSYLSGKHENIDVSYLQDDLGLSALPELRRLRENAEDQKVKNEALSAISETNLRSLGLKWYEQSIPYWNAKREIKN